MGEFDATYPTPTITVDRATAEDLKEAMMGSQTDPTYQEQFGITSAPLGTTGYKPPSMAELELEAIKAMARVQAEAVASQDANRIHDPFAPGAGDELEKFKKLYGASENEKGQLRKSQQELMEAFNGLMAQYEGLQSNANQPQWQPGMQPNAPQFGPPQGFAPQPQYGDPFAGFGDDDVIQGKQIKELFDRTVTPAYQYLAAQTQQAMARSAALEQRLLKQVKETSGITPVDEFRLIARNPWVRELAPAQRVQALASLMAAEVATQPVPQPQAPPQIPPVTEGQQRILNKLTYVEGATPQVPDSSEAALEAAKQRDYAKVMMTPQETGERAKMFRAWASKYGVTSIGQAPSDIAH
jgi:hypothetical protein